MNKSVLISIKPEWCAKIINGAKTIEGKIVNGEKTIEVRKTKPNIKTPFKNYIYCTKGGDLLIVGKENAATCYCGNGYVIGEFICDRIDEYWYPYYYNEIFCALSLWKLACLSIDEVWEYGKGKTLYGWHISDLKIYDEPKELREFRTICKYGDDYPCQICNKSKYDENNILYCNDILKRPPQSWCYVTQSRYYAEETE